MALFPPANLVEMCKEKPGPQKRNDARQGDRICRIGSRKPRGSSARYITCSEPISARGSCGACAAPRGVLAAELDRARRTRRVRIFDRAHRGKVGECRERHGARVYDFLGSPQKGGLTDEALRQRRCAVQEVKAIPDGGRFVNRAHSRRRGDGPHSPDRAEAVGRGQVLDCGPGLFLSVTRGRRVDRA